MFGGFVVSVRIRDGVEEHRYKVGSFVTQRLLLSHFFFSMYGISTTWDSFPVVIVLLLVVALKF